MSADKNSFRENPQRSGSTSRLLQSFRYAYEGLAFLLRTQRNARIHAFITAVVILLALWLQLSYSEWALLLLAMMTVWIAEMMNTALEAVVDMTMPRPHPLARAAKDVAAAAVLIGAFGAVLIGLLVLGPPLLARF